MSKLDRPMPSVSLAGDTDGTENIELYMDLCCWEWVKI
jgi:hypothetical protein